MNHSASQEEELEDSLSCWEEPAAGLYLEPDESSLHPLTLTALLALDQLRCSTFPSAFRFALITVTARSKA
jgi:hypothetical protein